jgi:hypothetical protein
LMVTRARPTLMTALTPCYIDEEEAAGMSALYLR